MAAALLLVASHGLLLPALGPRAPPHTSLTPVRAHCAMETVDMRRKRPEPADDAQKYGLDPRGRAEGVVADASVRTKPGKVGQLETVGQLQDSIDEADANSQLVVLKFVRDGCAACASTAQLFEDTAKELGADGLFYLVNYDTARDLCKLAKLKFVPAAHVYAKGSLRAALPLGKKKWDDFYEQLTALNAEMKP